MYHLVKGLIVVCVISKPVVYILLLIHTSEISCRPLTCRSTFSALMLRMVGTYIYVDAEQCFRYPSYGDRREISSMRSRYSSQDCRNQGIVVNLLYFK